MEIEAALVVNFSTSACGVSCPLFPLANRPQIVFAKWVSGSRSGLAYRTKWHISNLLQQVLSLVPKQCLERNSASLKGQELTEAQSSLYLFEKAAYPFLSTWLLQTTVKSLGSFPSFQAELTIRSCDWADSQKISDFRDMIQNFEMHLLLILGWLTVVPLRQSNL